MTENMDISEYWEQVKKGEGVREALIEIRALLRAGEPDCGCVENGDRILPTLLHHEDAKVRKNAALLMGQIRREGYPEALYEQYQKEEQMFVRSAYLTGLSAYDSGVLGSFEMGLRERYDELLASDEQESSRKHRDEELKALSVLLHGREETEGHTYRGFKTPVEVILSAAPGCLEAAKAMADDLCPDVQVRTFAAGLILKTRDISFAEEIRCVREVLIRIPGMEKVAADPKKAAEQAARAGIARVLAEGHRGKGTFFFRTEYRGKLEEKKKADFVKQFALQLERRTSGVMAGRASGYEVTIRLSEHKGDDLLCFVKLHTLRDERFDYRKDYIPESIKPVNAAGTVMIAKDYMQEGASVLDPFCGVGTMLIERHKLVPADTSYGIDYKASAIEGARANSERAGQIIHYIQKNFFDFEHEYLFDEILTDMPFAIGGKSTEEIRDTYMRFFPKAKEVLTADGTVILYSRDPGYVKRFCRPAGFEIIKEVPYSAKDHSAVFVLKQTVV